MHTGRRKVPPKRSRLMQTVTDALVLRERRLDEQDRLLTLLSAD